MTEPVISLEALGLTRRFGDFSAMHGIDLRVTLSASHTAEQLEQALEAFGHIGRELGLI